MTQQIQNNQKERPKVLIIGLDGGTWTVLKPAIEQGYMPFLKSQVEKGASGILKSTIPAITPAAWGGFQTGKNPGKTGVFNFSYWDKRTKKSHFVSAMDLGETLWDTLSRYDKRIAVLNVPMTYPPKPINGYLISGLPTPSMESNFTYPSELKEDLIESIPGYSIFDLKEISSYRSEDEHLKQFVHQLNAIIEKRTQAALWLLAKESFDVFMVHFQATDVLQHVFWHLLDPSHPLFDITKRIFIFENFYRILDQKIETIHQLFTKNNGTPLTLVISDHGFQSHFKRFNLGNWLATEGYLKIRNNVNPNKIPFLKKLTRTLRVGKLLSYIFPKTAIETIDRTLISKNELVYWNETRSYSIGKSSEGFIYLLESDPTKKAQLAQEICQKLMQIRDIEDGHRISQQIYLKNELYQGNKIENLPDIIVTPADDYTFTGHYQFDMGLFHTINSQTDMHIGKHHQDGIFIMAGDSIPHNSVNAEILDIMPTLLYYLGIPIPDEIDGQTLKNLFSGTYEVISPTLSKTGSPQNKLADIYTSEEIKEVEKRLEDLGYL